MKERPIPFNPPMVRAIREGRKTQTRRAVNPQPYEDPKWGLVWEPKGKGPHCPWYCQRNTAWNPITNASKSFWGERGGSPYGQPGDRLWVREEHFRFGHWEKVEGVRTNQGWQKWRFVADSEEVRFEAPAEFRKGRHHKDPATPAWHKRLARFMPRCASRVTLEIVSIRAERLQAISEADAIAEGLKPDHLWDRRNTPTGWWTGWAHRWESPCDAFREIWESINGADSWNANPWVWAIEFRRIEA